jgi:hypothetical protein
VPRPEDATVGDWLTCFPGFAMLTAGPPGAAAPPGVTGPPVGLRAGRATSVGRPTGPAASAECGELVAGAGVRLRWPDGELTTAVPAAVTGMGTA